MSQLRIDAERQDRLTRQRLELVVPRVMRRAGIDCWILICREYNEDPVMATMLPATWLSARRRTILVFIDRGETVERWAVSRYEVDDLFPTVWDPEGQPDQWACLRQLIEEADPKQIGINTSNTFALADGLSASARDQLRDVLPEHFSSRLVSAEEAAIGWLETRIPEEVEVMAEGCRLAHGFLRRALSPETIVPGETTTHQVEWWLREVVASTGLTVWFHPTVSVQRTDSEQPTSFAVKPGDELIRPGDLVHCDFGIVFNGLCTDQQQHAYVLREGEEKAPAGLAEALRLGNRLQDILMDQFATQQTGNQILQLAREAASESGINARIYSHPIGFHGHGAGPTIGLWDNQERVAEEGEYSLYPETAYSIELSARVEIPEWQGQTVNIMLEEDAFFDGNACRFLDGRQEELWLI